MKKFALSLGILLLFGSCSNDDGTSQRCEMIESVYVENKTGLLNQIDNNYFILESSNSYLPLQICNYEKLDLPSVTSESLEVIFEGNIEVLPETVDASSVLIEIKMIKVIK